MTHGEFDLFLVGTILMCCVMSVFNALKNGRRGWPGLILSVSFLIFAVTIYLYRTGAAPAIVGVSATVLFLLLCADFFFRVGKPPARKKR